MLFPVEKLIKVSKPVLFFVLLAILCLETVAAQSKLRFDSWTTDNDLPQNVILSITATPDGYLWLGTYDGLIRFDGVNFTVFNNINTQELKSNYVAAVFGDRRGDLWIGLEGGGVVRRTDNKFIHYSKNEGLSDETIEVFGEDAGGNVWVGTRNGGANVFRDGKFFALTVADGLPGSTVYAIEADDVGGVWLGTSGGLAYVKDSQITKYTTADGLPHNVIYSLLWNERDGLWIGTGKGVCRRREGQIEQIASKTPLAGNRLNSFQYSAEKELWIATDTDGIYRLQTDEMKAEKILGNVPDERVLRLYNDRQGSIWAATYGSGLLRYQKERLHHFTADEGFPDGIVWTVFEDSRSNLWMGLSNGLCRLSNGAVKTFKPSNTERMEIFTLTEDRAGSVWFGGSRVGKLAADQIEFPAEKNAPAIRGVFAIHGDRAGNLWIGTQTAGLHRFQDGQATPYTTEQGLASNNITAIFEDRQGTIWIGTFAGLSRFENERFSSWKLGEDSASNWINSFYDDLGGALWIGTSGGGLYRFKNGAFSKITSRNGLFDNLAFSIVESGGDLWMSSNRGIYRANLQELNDFADGKKLLVNSYAYGKSDGLLTSDTNGGRPGGWKTRDGFLWFATPKGVVRVDPNGRNPNPPSVLIEKIRLGEREFYASDNFQIDPGGENLEIQYTAISWQRPQQVKFRYRLVGLDHDWIEAGTRRTAYYPYLPPGEYAFQVIADNGEGVWNETGKTVRIQVLPPFYRTWTFTAACLVAVCLIAFGAYRVRVSRLERARLVQEEFSRRLINAHEAERHRIAAELHDSIGQTLAIIKNRSTFGGNTPENPTEARRQFDKITAQTTQAISEVREISYNLRPYLLDRLGLTKAIKSLVKKFEEVNFLKIQTDIGEIDDLFSKEAEMSIYRIIQESLNNVAKHSEAERAVLRIAKTDGNIIIRIEDDGCGFDLNAPPKTEAEKGGFGLLGMNERVRMLGGSLDIDTLIGQGTKITIKINAEAQKK